MQAKVAARASERPQSLEFHALCSPLRLGCSRPFANVFHFHPSKKPEGYV